MRTTKQSPAVTKKLKMSPAEYAAAAKVISDRLAAAREELRAMRKPRAFVPCTAREGTEAHTAWLAIMRDEMFANNKRLTAAENLVDRLERTYPDGMSRAERDEDGESDEDDDSDSEE